MSYETSVYQRMVYKSVPFKFPTMLYTSLQLFKEKVENDWDALILVTGNVGSGKSSLATAIAGVWEILWQRELSIDSFTWKAEGVVNMTDIKGNETFPIIFDEAIQGGTGRDSLTKTGNLLKITLVTKRRKKHLYIFIIDELQEYSKKIISRASLLIDVRTRIVKGKETRGFFKAYSQRELKQIYYLLKSNHINNIKDYNGKVKLFYTFPDYSNLFVSEKDYDDKKIEETQQIELSDSAITITTDMIKAFNMKKEGMTQLEIGIKLGKSRTTISEWLSKMSSQGLKI